MSKPWEKDWSNEGSAAEGSPKPWERGLESDQAKPRSTTEVVTDLGKSLAGSVVSAVGTVPVAAGRLLREGGEKAFGVTMDEAQRVATKAGTPDKALEWYEKANRFNPASLAGRGVEWVGQKIMQAGDDIRDARTDQAKEAARLSTPDGDITKPSTWTMGQAPSAEGVAHVLSDVVGSMAPNVAAAVATRGRSAAAQMAAGGATGAAQIGGAAIDEARDYLGAMSDADLAKASPVYRDLVAGGLDRESARTVLLRRAENTAAALAAPVGMLGGKATAAILGKPGEALASKVPGMGAKAVVLGALGATEEGLQEVGEGVATRAGINEAAGTDRSLTEGTFAEAILGAKAGGTVGAVRGAAAGIKMGEPDGQDPTQGAAPGAAPAAQAPAAAGGDGVAPIGASVSDQRRAATTVPAAGVATANTDEAERALRAPVQLTALDRADELGAEISRIDARMAELAPENGYGPAFDGERAELQQAAEAARAEREQIAATWPTAIKGAPTSFSTEAGVKLDGEYALVDADDLVTSHDENLRANPLFPAELQPRDRSRSASELQVSGIVQKLDPARLGVSADAATGAPIVGADGLVESGNARTIALKRVYQANGQKAADYKAWLRQSAEQFGITPDAVDGLRKPVLVRVRNTPVNRAEFARQANQSTIQRMSPSEQAMADAKRLTSLEGLNPDENGDFTSSHDFIRQFMATLPITEQSDMIESDGRLSTTGYRRMQNAVLAKAYGESPTLRRMTESLDNNLVNISKALTRAAPVIAAARDRIAAGGLFDADISGDLVQAVEGLSAIKDKGWTVAQELGQTDLTGPKYSPEAAELLQFLADNVRSPRRIAEFLQRYYEALEAAGDPNQGSLLGDTAAPERAALMQQARGNDDGQQAARPAQEDRQQPQDAPGGGQSARADEGRSGQDAGAGQQGTEGGSPEWVMFPPDSGTLGIPRASMPQVKAEARPALIAFLKSRGIEHERATVPAADLKPTQAEFSPAKVKGWVESTTKGDRSVLVSADGYVLDGHHQWMGSVAANADSAVIRFNAPIKELLAVVRAFPGVKQSDGADTGLMLQRAQAVADFKDALADLAQIASKHTRAAMVPENTPDLVPTMVKLFDAAIKLVGTDMKRTTAWVKAQLKADPRFKAFWNKIGPDLYSKAALQAMEKPAAKSGQASLFDDDAQAADAVQGDLFDMAAMLAEPVVKAAKINGREYNPARDNFKPPEASTFLSPEMLAQADEFVAKFYKGKPEFEMSEADRAAAAALLAPFLKRAEDAKAEYDQKIIDIAKRTGALGQMLAPIKGVKRASEKMKQDQIDKGAPSMDPADVKDMLRSTIVVSSYAEAGPVLEAIAKEFDVTRVKDKTAAGAREANGGYADISLNVKMPNGVIAEIQVNVPQMLTIKEAQGHKLYEAARDLPAGSRKQAEVYDAMRGIYEAAFRAASKAPTPPAANSRADAALPTKAASEIGAPVAGPLASMPGSGTKEAPSSDNLNQAPSGKRTKSSEKSVTNSQPGGKESGNFIGTPLGDSVPLQTVNGYNEPDLFGGRDANAQPGDGNPQSEGADLARGAAGKRDADSVRARGGRGNQQQRGDRDPGAAPAGTVGQAGPDGKRGADARSRSDEPRAGAGRVGGVPAGRDIAVKTGRNYTFGPDDLTYEGSWVKKAEQNIAAVELIKALQKEGRQATREEQSVLAKFIGWGASDLANNLFGKKLDQAAEALREYDAAVKAMDALNRDYLNKGGQYRGHYADNGYYQAVGVLRAAGKVQAHVFPLKVTRAELDAARPDASTRKWIELRDRLKAALTPDEFADAARSTQYAHYTSKAVVSSMWKAAQRMGFAGGTIVEPGAGIGVFPGLMPAEVANSSSYTGIEFDPITGAILQQLFPDERNLVESFVDTKLPKNFYDVAIGNPPFSGTKILSDPEYAKQAFSLHDYFFAKTIDRVKPGGLVMFVTSRYTMDKVDDKARKYLMERADLVGAIRMPQTAFKQNAGTEVVTDALFLRKKVPGEKFEGAQAWGKVTPATGADGKPLMVSDGEGKPDRPAMINEYFAAHPEMVLGQHANTGSMYRDKEYTVVPLPGDIEAHFAKAVESLPKDIYTAQRGSAAEAAKVREIDFNPKAQKEGNYYVTDAGVLMVREGGVGQRVELRSQKDVELIKDFVPLRDALKQAHYDQLNDGDWEASLRSLQTAYAAFTKKHGQINQFVLKSVKTKAVDEDTGESYVDESQVRTFPLLQKLRDDPDYTLVAALETINDDTGEIKPSDFVTKRVLGKPESAAVNSPADALLTVLNDVGHVDIALIAARVGMSEADTIEALGTAIYQDPETGWQTADEYLSGNVKRKLDAARAAAKADRRYERNVTALEGAQPAPKVPSQIDPAIGMNWIPGDVYAQFLKETAGVVANIEWNARTKQWIVQEKSGGKTMAATNDWGTAERNVTDLLEVALTGRQIRITRSVGSGSDRKTEFDAPATELANQKLDALREAFSSWVWRDADRTDRLVKIYNDTFNTTVPRSFDGRHLTLPGTSKAFHVFDHVKRGAWRIIQRGNTYLAHAVGSGKTFQMVIAAMEQKRLGLIKKPMVVVPNHMLKQFAHEWQLLYPAARLMVADENNFHTDNRRRFVSRVALSDLDGVIITHSAFKLLDLDPEFKAKMIQEQLDFMEASLEEAKSNDDTGRSPRVKQIQKQVENLEEKLKAALSSEGKDKNVRFDELGVDFLMVDEAHEYRKLEFGTSRQVKGISPEGSQKAFDLFMKSRYLEEKTPGRSLVMASGTVITNTLAELYTVQKFMDRQALVDKGIDDFDSWAAMFGRERTALEPDASGKYTPVTRFSKFVNVPELTQMFREYADVLTSDHLAALLGDKRPKVEGGSRDIKVTPKTNSYAMYQKELEQRVRISKEWKPSKDEPNNPDPMIRIIGDGRLAAIDMRFIDPSWPNDPDSKLNVMITDVIAKFKETADMEYRDKAGNVEPNKGATMMVFSDLGFGEGVAKTRGFNARAWFEKRLRDEGIPMDKVAFMSDYKKSADKLKLFKDVNAGRVRVLVGSSKNMGTGVNAQQRLKALFHLDSPWYPADLEQREGRIVRQGNKNPLVQIFAYAAKGTYDETMWKMLASKQYFIDQAMSGDENLREIEDLDSQSQFDLAAALVAEDPRILQLAGLRAEVEKLHRLFRAHEDQRQRFRSQYDVASATAEFNAKILPDAEKMAGQAQDLSGDKFTAKVMGKTHTERAKWGEALVARFNELAAKVEPQAQGIGEISGFKISYEPETVDGKFIASMRIGTPNVGYLHFSNEAEPNAAGLAMRAQNAVAEVARLPGKLRERITEANAQMDALRERLSAPFPMAGMLADKVKEANDLEAVITAEGKAKEAAAKGAQQAANLTGQDGGTRLSLRERDGATDRLDFPKLQALAQRLKARMPNMPKVHVLEDPSKAPKALREYIIRQDAWYDVEGAMHDGELYLFASGLADEARAEHVLLEHEAAHYGLRAILGPSLKTAMRLVYIQNASVRRAVADLQKRGKLSDLVATEEVIVDIPTAELARLKGWRKVVDQVRAWLAERGYTALAERIGAWLQGTLSQQQRADLFVAELVSAARDYVAGKVPARAAVGMGTRLSGTLAEDIERQEKWLQREAQARGFKDIEDLLARDYPLFEKLAELWRKKNPAEVLLSRGKNGAMPETTAPGPQGDAQQGATQGNAVTAAAEQILQAMRMDSESDPYADYGLRVIPGDFTGEIAIGDELPLSNQWNDGEDTGEPLSGTSAIAIQKTTLDAIEKALRLTGADGSTRGPNGYYWGDRVVLIKGDRKGGGEDVGEILLKDATVVGMWKKSSKGASAIQPNDQSAPDTDGARLSRAAPPAGTAKPAAERAEAIIQKKAAGAAPLDRVAKLATRVTGVDRLTGAIYGKAGDLLARLTPEKVKAGLVSDYGVPEAVIDQRIMLQGRQRVQLRKVGNLIDKLSTLTREESRVAYEWMNMDGADPKAYLSAMQGLPEESVRVLQDVQKMIDDLSQEAVRLGQLDPESFKRNRFAYLRRSYAKHIIDQTTGEKAKRARVISILGDQYKGRGLVQAEPMAKMQAEAPDWWGRKLAAGKADTALKGQKFVRLEKRTLPGQASKAIAGMAPAGAGRVQAVTYWPADLAVPAKFADWTRADTWEVRDVKGGNVVLWRDFTKDEREKMGEIDEARFAIAKTLQGMVHDVEVGRYLEWLGKNYAKAEGQPIPGVVVEASERMRDTFAPGEWVKVPDTKIPGTGVLKYGKLAGKYLPGPVWNDLRQVVAGGHFKPFGETYATILRWWKTSKTALSPGVHMNNVMSNMVMADWQDVRAAHVGKALRIILAATGTKGGIADKEAALEIMNRYKDSGGDIGTFATQEIARDQLDPLLADLETELATTGDSPAAQAGIYMALQHALGLRFPEAWEALKSGRSGKAVGKAGGALIDLYQAEDDVFRLAAWLKAKEEGADDLGAGKVARRSFLDYNINAPWVQAMRASAWPFISFTYRAVPLLAEIAGKKPYKLMKLMLLAGGLNALGVLMGGDGDDDERKMLPEEKAGKIWGMVPKLIRMPWNDAHGSPVYLDIRRWVPVGDVFDVGAGNAAIPMFPGLMPGGPLVLAGEVVLNKSAFTGKAITLETDTGAEKAAKLGDYLYKAFAPNLLGLPNTYATEGVVGAATGRTDAFGREMSTAQAMASAFGVKLGSYPADVLRRNLGAKAQAELSEIDLTIGQLKRQLATGRIDRADFDEQAGEQLEKKRKLLEKVRERMD